MGNQEKFKKLIIRLENYGAKGNKKEEKNKVLESAIKLFNVRENIADYFKQGIFSFKGNAFKTKEEILEEKKEETKEEYINNIFTFIEEKSKDINNDLLTKYFNFSAPIDLTNK